MSVFLEDDLLDVYEVDPLDLLTCGAFEAGSSLWVSTLGQLRVEGLEVSRDDIPEFPGHAQARRPAGRFGSGLRTRLAASAVPYGLPRRPQ